MVCMLMWRKTFKKQLEDTINLSRNLIFNVGGPINFVCDYYENCGGIKSQMMKLILMEKTTILFQNKKQKVIHIK